MKIVSDGVRYHVDISGEGEPLLLLHGFTGSRETWNSLVPLLGSKHKLIMVDIIGHGDTDSPDDCNRYKIERVAKDLQYIIKALELEKVDMLGYSMGGRLALTFACMFPQYINKLILESASPGLLTVEERRMRRRQDKELAERILHVGLNRFIDYWESIPLFETQRNLPSDQLREMRKQRLSNSETGLANSLIAMGTGSQPSWWDRLPHLKFPILLVTGELDDKFCRIASQMQKQMKNGDWQIIKGCGHAIHVEDIKKFGKIISRFLFKE
ncbi:2-succinyl-6-hydroxy-2,4-cyclohexadiene-1-carboxylate synthase [Bacillus sp. CECT 9360]|uniref:2-succinyl-6-hydroxy-2, 4-cyclohexadiene-1-carboxylate synthase n=1 Tax=Bacillus sp. CECT 9360 TaxID=2845821 RepID=UPI001E431BBB|nr:2-succinyl-6-hydroxy-2,4-cyclohexadiene-1-carboxylate synthase [Bacillus sp. CECT 9360]CAH0346779.1 2-succinyl-6-hydroxy-2, 4-cyclohexadiene-1-carboxylate synthase [Bacillus sp. CECT 9360]